MALCSAPLGAVLIIVLLYGAGANIFVYCKSSFPCDTRVEDNDTSLESNKLRVEPNYLVPKELLTPLNKEGELTAPVAPIDPKTEKADENFDPKKADDKNRSLLAQQYSARINWVFLMVVYLLLCIAALLAAIISVWQTFRTRNWGKVWAMVAVIVIPIGIPALSGVVLLFVWDPPTVILPLLENTVQKGFAEHIVTVVKG